jgi:outer membrane protein W
LTSIDPKNKMKKIFILLTIALILSYSSFAQNKETAYSKGSSTISVGYGLFNVWKILLSNYEKINSTGPIVVAYQYGITKRISVGLALGYSVLNGSYESSGFNYSDKLTSFSAVAFANYHFGHSKKIDPYIGGGAGYYNLKYEESIDLRSISPSAFEISGLLGAKYYFTPSFGAFAEIDLVNGYVEGSFPQLGVTYKIK